MSVGRKNAWARIRLLASRVAFKREVDASRRCPSGGAKFQIRPTYSVKVIIRHDENTKSGYRVVTSFPFNPE